MNFFFAHSDASSCLLHLSSAIWSSMTEIWLSMAEISALVSCGGPGCDDCRAGEVGSLLLMARSSFLIALVAWILTCAHGRAALLRTFGWMDGSWVEFTFTLKNLKELQLKCTPFTLGNLKELSEEGLGDSLLYPQQCSCSILFNPVHSCPFLSNPVQS